jgi:hypothetical protein
MKIAIVNIVANRSDLKKIIRTETLRIEEVSEESYFSTLIDIAMEKLSTQI